MLDTLRQSTHGVFGKILLAFLVLSFGIWGIADVFHNVGGAGAVATVGKKSISFQEYSRALRSRQEELQARLGNAYTPELMEKLGLGMMVRDELVNSLLMETEAETLGVVPGDDQLADVIRRNPAFQDKDGKFDRNAYLSRLKGRGFTEQHYAAELRKNIAARLLEDTLVSAAVVPEGLMKMVYAVRGEQRVVNLRMLSSNAVKPPAALGEQEIKSYYEEHMKSFMLPEYRSISYVDMKIADIQSKIDIAEEEAKRFYEEHKQDFHKPEQRELAQLLFAKEEDAAKAADRIAHGTAFADVAANSPLLNKKKIALGLVSKQDIPAAEANIVFALKEGESSKPFKSDFGWHILRVNRIVPEGTLTFDEAKADIIRDMKASKAAETIARLANQATDALAGGKTVEEAAKDVGFKVESVKGINHEGMAQDGKKIPLPAYDNFLNVAFSTPEREHSQATQAADGSYFIMRVDEVMPEHPSPLVEVKGRVISALMAQKASKDLEQAATDAAEKLRNAKKPDVQLGEMTGVKIKRTGEAAGNVNLKLPPDLVKELFSLEPGKVSHAYKAPDGRYMIAETVSVIPAPAEMDAKTHEQLTNELQNALRTNLMHDYMLYLRGKHRVSVNAAVVGPDGGMPEGEE